MTPAYSAGRPYRRALSTNSRTVFKCAKIWYASEKFILVNLSSSDLKSAHVGYRLRPAYPELLFLGFQLRELLPLLLQRRIFECKVSNNEPVRQLVHCPVDSNLLVFSTPMCEFIPDLLEDSDSPQREILIDCNLPNGSVSVPKLLGRRRTVMIVVQPYLSNARICSPNPCLDS